MAKTKRAAASTSKSAPTIVAGIDLGGTNMQIGIVDERNRIIGREGRKTKAAEGSGAVIRRIVTGVQAAAKEAGLTLRDLKAVGIAAPGAIDIPRGVVLEAPNLRWRDYPLRKVLEAKLKRPVIVDNDVNGAVWGESRLGAARPKGKGDTGDVLGVWVGTGVGGGLVFNGRLHYGEFFTAGEVGHAILFPGGAPGRRTVEDYCSRTGMSRTIGERLPDHPQSPLAEVFREHGGITGSKKLARAFAAGDELANAVVNEAAFLLGIAIANWVTVLALDTVIIGGGVTEALGEPFLRHIRASFRKHVFPDRCKKARLLMTQLKDDAGILGAALLARQHPAISGN